VVQGAALGSSTLGGLFFVLVLLPPMVCLTLLVPSEDAVEVVTPLHFLDADLTDLVDKEGSLADASRLVFRSLSYSS
jgi:hypothetical protein